jgi:hypothetical protein
MHSRALTSDDRVVLLRVSGLNDEHRLARVLRETRREDHTAESTTGNHIVVCLATNERAVIDLLSVTLGVPWRSARERERREREE